MAKMRSPNYPAVGLQEAIESARKLWDREKRTAVDMESIANAWEYKGVSGRVRSKVGALRKYGLLESTPNGLRISDLGVKVLNTLPDSPEYLDAVREAAVLPGLFRELYQSHKEASDKSISSYLVVKKGFSPLGAREAAKAFRDTMDVAKMGEINYIPHGSAVEDEDDMTSVEGIPVAPAKYYNGGTVPTVVVPRAEEKTTMAFRWLIGAGVVAEVKLIGGSVKPAHIEMLKKQLELTKSALEMDSPEDAEAEKT